MAASKACQHFGLRLPPFEGKPDPRFYVPNPTHGEALATLQYAVHAAKACTVVLGESGSGKTLLGRLLAQGVAERSGVLWVHGIGQPPDQTEVTVCPPGALAGDEPRRGAHLEESSLARWIRGHMSRSAPVLLIVDNADGLRDHNWEDILAVVTREIRAPRPLSVVLLGLPGLAHRLAGAQLVRLRRRIFRTCQLARLTRDELGQYVRQRLVTAGAADGAALFTPAALDLIHRLSGGNPALINQICDNAMVDAFGDDRTQIDGPHILATIQAITGGLARTPVLPAATPPAPGGLPAPAIPENWRTPAGLRMLTGPAPAAPAPDTPPLEVEIAARAGISDGPPPAAPGVTYVPLDQRLRALEQRLSEALARVRVARTQRVPVPPAPDPAPEPTGRALAAVDWPEAPRPADGAAPAGFAAGPGDAAAG